MSRLAAALSESESEKECQGPGVRVPNLCRAARALNKLNLYFLWPMTVMRQHWQKKMAKKADGTFKWQPYTNVLGRGRAGDV